MLFTYKLTELMYFKTFIIISMKLLTDTCILKLASNYAEATSVTIINLVSNKPQCVLLRIITFHGDNIFLYHPDQYQR